jgi:enoyl-CoA hydratase/carnithine racemase
MTVTMSQAPPPLEAMAVQVTDEVAVVLLTRPDSGNTVTPEVLAEFEQALAWVAAEDSVRALVIAAEGRAFSLGGDLRVIKATLEDGEHDPVTEVDRAVGGLADAILALRRLTKPTVAAVNGQAAGAGFSLALACDVRVASQSAAFNFAYGALGGSPDGGMTYFLPRVVAPARAVELLMEQPVLRARAAHAEGIVSQVVSREELMDTALRTARRLGAKAPHSIRAARELVESALALSLPDQLARERDLFAQAVRTHDFREGVTAALEGRRPTFAGH